MARTGWEGVHKYGGTEVSLLTPQTLTLTGALSKTIVAFFRFLASAVLSEGTELCGVFQPDRHRRNKSLRDL